jgi:hypothetical protein
MLYVFADESHDEKRQQVLTMAGLMGSKSTWNTWTMGWSSVLAVEHVSVFHAADCDGAHGEFKDWERDRIESLQHKLITLTNDRNSGLRGYSVSIPIPPHESLRSRIRRFLTFAKRSPYSGPLDDPYFFALGFLVTTVADEPDVPTLPAEEKIGFVFDQHQLEGRGKAIYWATRAVEDFKERLAGVAFRDKARVVQLQAADLLAYETYRHWANVARGLPDRWQYTAIRRIVRAEIMLTASDLEKLVQIGEAAMKRMGGG